jgi:hypothetical protein
MDAVLAELREGRPDGGLEVDTQTDTSLSPDGGGGRTLDETDLVIETVGVLRRPPRQELHAGREGSVDPHTLFEGIDSPPPLGIHLPDVSLTLLSSSEDQTSLLLETLAFVRHVFDVGSGEFLALDAEVECLNVLSEGSEVGLSGP